MWAGRGEGRAPARAAPCAPPPLTLLLLGAQQVLLSKQLVLAQDEVSVAAALHMRARVSAGEGTRR